MIQFRPMGESGPMYAPARDLVYVYTDIVRETNRRLEQEADPDVTKLLQERGVRFEDLVAAAKAFAAFLNLAHDASKSKDIVEALYQSGWFTVPVTARIAYMYYIGTCTTGSFFWGLRQVTQQGEPPPAEARFYSLNSSIRRLLLLTRLAEKPRLRYFRWRRLCRVVRRFLGLWRRS